MLDDNDDKYLDDLDGADNEAYIAERDTALAEFREQLFDNVSRFDYDEYQWISLFDYADDAGETYLADRAVTLGLIQYPDSGPLDDRRLYQLFDIYGPEDSREAFRNTLKHSDMPTRYVRMQNKYYDWQELPATADKPQRGYKAVSQILLEDDDKSKIQDFDIIEAIRILTDMEALPYMARDMEKWEKRCYSKEMLWCEFANAANDINRSDMVLPVVEKLISEFPYNRMYWMMKARALTAETMNHGVTSLDEATGKIDELINIFDTALAIDPDDEMATLMREKIVSARDQMAQEALIKSPCGDISSLPVLARKPSDPMSLTDLMQLFDINTDESTQIIRSWVSYQIGMLDSDAEDTWSSSFLEQPGFYELIEALYMQGRTTEVDAILNIIADVTKEEHYALYPLMALRCIEEGQYLFASQYIMNLSTELPSFRLNPTKLLLSLILEKHLHPEGNDVRALENAFITELTGYHTEIDSKSKSFLGCVNPAVTYYFIKYFVDSTLPERKY